jgi:hypothetical protein
VPVVSSRDDTLRFPRPRWYDDGLAGYYEGRFVRTIVTLLLAAAVATADPKPGDVGTPEHEKAAALVKQLGDKRFAAREAAAKKLIEMGLAAISALTAGTKSDDVEVRNRSTALLRQVKTDEWNRRAAAYQADLDGKQKHDLPLVGHWEKMIGKPDAASRRLFAEMVRINGDLLELASSDRKVAQLTLATQTRELLKSIRQRYVRGKDRQQELPVGQLASILFVEAVVDKNTDVDRFDANRPNFLLYNPGVFSALDAKEIGPAFRVLVTEWMKSRPATDINAINSFTDLTIRRPIPEAVPQLVRLVNQFRGPTGSEALLGISKAGTDKAKVALAGMLNDSSAMWEKWDKSHERAIKPQLRDCALAALARMSGKEPEEFGLTKSIIHWALEFDDPTERIVVQLYGFATLEARQKGFEKWASQLPKK